MNSLPPYFPSQQFNSLAFQNGTNLTKSDLDKLYLPLAAGKNLYLIDAIVPGVVLASKAVIVDASKNITGFNSIGISRNTGDLLSLTATDTNSRSTIKFNCPGVDMEVGLRSATTGTAPSHYYRYGLGGYRYVQSMINGDAINYGRYTINTSGSHLSLVNNAVNALIEITAGDQLRLVRGYAMNLNGTGLRLQSASTADARTALDLGQQVSDKVIIFNEPQNSGGDVYSIGCNNTNMIYSAGQGHRFVKSNASPAVNTSDLASIDGNGVLRVSNNTICTKGWFCPNSSFSNPSARVGIGLACHMANASFGELFSWDYTNSLWKDLKINNTMYVNGTNSFVQIGSNPGNPVYPLSVSGNFTTSFGGGYGYLNNSGAGTGTGTGSVPVTCFLQHRLWCSEVNAFSDRRLKENFKEIDEEDAVEFVKKIKPVSYNWKSDKNKNINIGYVAQDILKLRKFDSLVSLGPDEDLNEEIDEDGLVSPSKHRFLVSYQSAVPVLHAALKHALEEIEMLKLFIKK